MTKVIEKEDRLELIQRLSGVIEETLWPLIRPGEPCALLDFPNYANVGDSAIWLGAVGCLKKLGAVITYTSDISNHSNKVLSEKIGHGTILLNGGGNVGDTWPAHQSFREMIIETFPNHSIVQLPQSICFKNRENLRRAKKIFNRHADLTLLVRDQESFNVAKNEFKCQVFLCPDMAFALGPLEVAADSGKRGLALLRSDGESALNGAALWAELDRTDWLKDDFSLALFIYKQAAGLCREFPNRLRSASHRLSKCYDTVAGIRLTRGSHLLSRYGYVVTDRLHGHVLCVLLGIRHICLDNNNGKLKNFYETWTSDCALTHWAMSTQEAMEWLRLEGIHD